MPFSEIELKKIDNLVGGLCRKRSPTLLKHEIRTEHSINGYDVVVFECRPKWDAPDVWLQIPFAKIKFTRSTSEWKLYWHRSNGKWDVYESFHPTKDLLELVNEIDNDPFHVFFG